LTVPRCQLVHEAAVRRLPGCSVLASQRNNRVLSLQSRHNEYKNLSYRRESAHLILLYRTVQKAFRIFDMLNRLGVDHQRQSDRRTDGRTDEQAHRQTKAIILYYSADKPISIKDRAQTDFRHAKRPTRPLYDSEQMKSPHSV